MKPKPIGSTETEMFFEVIRQIENWFRNSMSTDLLGHLAVNTMHDPTILVLKTSLCNVYMNIHPQRIMVYSLFIVALFIKFLYILEIQLMEKWQQILLLQYLF